jgi:hypothetical protein
MILWCSVLASDLSIDYHANENKKREHMKSLNVLLHVKEY